MQKKIYFDRVRSLPSWECGLKSLTAEALEDIKRHSPRGSVD